ncbi:coiled-coil domain-containing protein 55 [Pseudohyphozyma bogoriensis]|nr:coiled-coil domain-containing protein 55 [Pseudohyphozyma bogoriensis]
MDPPKLSFGGIKTSFKSSALPKKALPKRSAFGGDDDDDEPSAPHPSTSTANAMNKTKTSTATLSKAQKAKQAEELALDSSVYEYDEVFDRMKEATRKADEAKKQDAGDRKPKYISRLIETAAQRKQDHLRAEDKMVQREREMEGDEFKDKDAFVTPAYLAQQEEIRRLEEEEKKAEEKSKAKPGRMASFYASYLANNDAAHEAAVAASLAKPSDSPSTSTSPKPTLGPKPLSEAEQAAELERNTGRKVEVNDDGQIIDYREMHGGGLNIKKKTGDGGKGLGFSAPISERKKAVEDEERQKKIEMERERERGRQSRERHSREIQRQMLELEEKRKREAEEALEQKVTKVAKRNTNDRVEELKRAAEERRKKREEELRAAADK